LRPVAKRSLGKASAGGRKWAYRSFDSDGFVLAENLLISDRLPAGPGPGEPLQHRFVAEGEVLLRHSVEEAREYHVAARSRLRQEHLSIQAGPPALVASTRQPPVSAGR
jgi:nicotinate phosphoribosyltransferase